MACQRAPRKRVALVKYHLAKNAAGQWQAVLELPAGDGSLQAVAQSLDRFEALHKAAKVAQKHGTSPAKARAVAVLAKGAAALTPGLRDMLRTQGLEAAKTAAMAMPGGGVVVAALNLAQKYGPAKRLLGKLLPF